MANILIASPDVDEAEQFEYALRFAGHTVKIVNEGDKAFHLPNDLQVDLILVDASSPGSFDDQWQSGNVNQGDPVIPIIFLVEQGHDPSLEEKLKSHHQEYLMKPISLDHLTKKVNRALKKRK